MRNEKDSNVELEELKQEIALRSQELSKNELNNSFKTFLGDTEKTEKEIARHNKKKFKIFKKLDKDTTDDFSAVERYQTRYNRETWFYKRHKDTIDKYTKKTKEKNRDNLVLDEEGDALRVGFYAMVFYVWFDLILSFITNVLIFPIHITRIVAEQFAKMRKDIMWATIIVISLILVSLGLGFGIKALINYARVVG